MPKAINGIKQCSKCREFKTVEEYGKNKTHSDALHPHCKFCVKEANRKYRENNPEKVKEKNRKYYKKNLEKVKEKNRKHQVNNPEKAREKDRKYYENHPERARESTRKYNMKCRIALKLVKELNLIEIPKNITKGEKRNLARSAYKLVKDLKLME